MKFQHKIICLLILTMITLSCISAVSASMEIEGGAFSTNGGLEDLTYASIYVGEEYSGDAVIIQIFYSRDGSLLNNGNMVPNTVTYDGYVNVKSADAYRYFPDHAKINLYDSNSNLMDSQEVKLSPESGVQTFGVKDYDHSYIYGGSSSGSSTSTSSSGSGGSTYHSGTSNSYIGNSETGKFHAPGCGDVDKMNPSNKVSFSSRDEAISRGYSPCGHCSP
ncbi:Ada metal-binding domain-containing protein [Methanobrevibacter sp.]|uniref:Ada metal-binding domain-containing protein n=1 Tax=Methanobrevibacter sp. TaxID=66852 RepID=UPI0025E5E064|nr:Ada metal-binding domain-containing protein [Methanobrevibacter sp.]MBR4447194.1 hypothetical protein [Methanobrevibacter sp.]